MLAADSIAIGSGQFLGALELERYDGPWDLPQDLDKKNALLRWSRGDSLSGLSLSLMAYDNSWDSTDQVPRRAVDEGAIDRFGFIDPSDGGDTRRDQPLAVTGDAASNDSLWHLSAYAMDYELALFSNFTYFLDDPVNGDQFEQRDERRVYGAALERQWLGSVAWLGGREVETTVGFDARFDDIENGLHLTAARQRLSTTREDSIDQWGGGAYAQARVRWNPWLRSVAGLRLEGYSAEVDSDLAINSGERDDSILAPKLSLVFGPWKATEWTRQSRRGLPQQRRPRRHAASRSAHG